MFTFMKVQHPNPMLQSLSVRGEGNMIVDLWLNVVQSGRREWW